MLPRVTVASHCVQKKRVLLSAHTLKQLRGVFADTSAFQSQNIWFVVLVFVVYSGRSHWSRTTTHSYDKVQNLSGKSLVGAILLIAKQFLFTIILHL